MSPLDPDAVEVPALGLGELVERCVAQYATDGPPALEAACALYPQHAKALRRRLTILERSGLLRTEAPAIAYPKQLGDFRLLDLIGEGGMGAVFRAQQVSLNRIVALKVIRGDLAYSPRSRERFRREIEAIAAMRSSGIVQVYLVGDDDGVPYYAMELVDGINLHDLVLELRRVPPERLTGHDIRTALLRVERRHESSSTASESEDPFEGTYAQACCRIALRVARTLAYAHERGVLHRDVKPSNVMIDHGGRVLLLDFGLARAVESEAEGLTRTGGIVGSLAYMAPEQMRGERNIDACVDVYGLGVTLYELLTHRAAFRGDTQEELRTRVLTGTVPSPAQLNPAVPRDAETICLKAMAPERSRRYPTAQALADDLQRLLELRPIAARRAGWFHRVRRWAQRHPAKATALGAGALLTIGGPTLIAVQQAAARVEITAALDRAQSYQTSYEHALTSALDGMERTTMRLANDEQMASGKLDGLRKDLLEGAAGFWQTMADVDDPHPQVRDALFRSRSILAMLRRELGDLAGARSVLDAAVAELERNLEGGVSPAQKLHLDQQLAKVLFDQGDVLLAQRELRAAIAALTRSAAIAEANLDAAPNPRGVLRHIGRCRLNIAQAQVQQGEAKVAVKTCREVIAALDQDGDNDMVLRARTLLAALLLHSGQYDEALPALETAIAMRTAQAAKDPADAANLRDLKSAHHNLGMLYQQRSDLGSARRHLEHAAALARQLLAAFPARVDNKLALLSSIMVLGNVYLRLDEKDLAERTCRDGVAQAEQVARDHPDVPDALSTLAEVRSTLAQILMETEGKRAEALRLLQAAAATHETLAAAPEATFEAVAHHATTRGLLASALAQDGQLEASVVEEDLALDAFAATLARDAGNRVFCGNAGRVIASSVARALRRGDDERVRGLLQRATEPAALETTVWSLLESMPGPERAKLARLRPTSKQ